MAVLPLRTNIRGPAPKENNQNFQSDADRTLIYVTLYISECLRALLKVFDFFVRLIFCNNNFF